MVSQSSLKYLQLFPHRAHRLSGSSILCLGHLAHGILQGAQLHQQVL